MVHPVEMASYSGSSEFSLDLKLGAETCQPVMVSVSEPPLLVFRSYILMRCTDLSRTASIITVVSFSYALSTTKEWQSKFSKL